MKRTTLAILGLLSFLYLAPASTAATVTPREVELREASSRDHDDALLPRLARLIAKGLWIVRSNIDAAVPPRP